MLEPACRSALEHSPARPGREQDATHECPVHDTGPRGYSGLTAPGTFTYYRSQGVYEYLNITMFAGEKHDAADELHKLGDDAKPFAQRSQPDSWAFAAHNPNFPNSEDYLVFSAKVFGDRELECHVRATPLNDEDVKALVPKIEDICLSATPKTE